MLTWVEINSSNLQHNISAFRKLIGDNRLLMPVIKANAYGHGIHEIGKLLDNNKNVDVLCVASLDEALTLRSDGIKKPILILSYYDLDAEKVSLAVQSNIAFPLYTVEQLRFLNTVGERVHINPKVHIKIDTGTSRVGILPENIPDYIHELKKCSSITVEGLWSHFASSETDEKLTNKQLNTLLFAESLFAKEGIEIKIKHEACTAAAALNKESRLDAVRIGLGTYGLYPAKKVRTKIALKPVLSFKTSIIQVKQVTKGTKVSYGGTYTMARNGTIAVLPVGYADGLNRAWSNKAEVLVKGKRCPVIGRICMNVTMIDVSKIKNCEAGDTVTIIGKEKNDEITTDELANLTAGTINYEIPTQLSPLLPRKVV